MICYLLFTLFLLINKTTYSLNPERLCVNCQYFSVNKNTDTVFGKCIALPKTEENEKRYLVTGSHKNDDYLFCYSARSSDTMCGKEGKRYRKKYTWKND